MWDSLLDAFIDTIKIFPFLVIAFVILEYLEHKLTKKNKRYLENSKRIGPLVGGILGGFPQCGFSAMAASLYASRVITMGTIIAVFLATSDEMLPIMLSSDIDKSLVFRIIGFKVLIGIIIGFIVDFLYHSKSESNDIHDLCEKDHCDCSHKGVIYSGVRHALKISLFILITNIFINLIIFFIGEDTLKNILYQKNIFTYFIASLVGLIPNCASSIVITELYLSNFITIGTLFSGLLTGSGIGILLLFKSNESLKENISILSIIYFVGVVVGIIIDLII